MVMTAVKNTNTTTDKDNVDVSKNDCHEVEEKVGLYFAASEEHGTRKEDVAATRVVRTLPADKDSIVDEVMENLTKGAGEKDSERAARYVATVRPAMASARYVRADVAALREYNAGDTQRNRELEHQNEEGVHPGNVENRQATRNVGHTEEGAADATSIKVDSEKESSYVALSEELPQRSETTNSNVNQIRAARKLAQNQKKRARVKRVLVLRRTAARTERQQQIDRAEAKAQRRGIADEALEQLEQRRLRQPRTSGGAERQRDGEPAKVRLVQRREDGVATNAEDEEKVRYAEADDGLPTAYMVVAGERRSVKLDSGARYSVAGTDWMLFGDKLPGVSPVDYVEGIGGFLLDVVGVWRFEMISAFGEIVRVDACIVDGCTSEFLLGVDFMREQEATMDFSKNELRYSEPGRSIVIPFRTSDKTKHIKVAAVRMARKTILSGSTVTPVEIAVTAEDGERGIFMPTLKLGSVMLSATVTEAHNGKAWVPAINAGRKRVKMPSKKELGRWIPLDADVEVLELNGALQPERLRDWLNELGKDEPLENEEEAHIGTKDEDDRTLILRLLRAYRHLVKDTGDCPPSTALEVEHHIDTGDAAPIMLKRRRQAQSEDAVVESNVRKMLAAGVIEEGNGAWGFPVVLVRKKDGEVRFCVDYRALNKVTHKDVYPLPRIDETLEALGGALWFTTLDLKSGYWQIRMADGDKPKTAFTTKQGLYQFVRMPFGLTNAPSTFQRMMNSVLRGLTWVTCLVYLDDIVIYTRGGIERHVLELACVLERLSIAGLTLKLKKCRFATQRMEYLGHELSCEGVRPLERLVSAVREFPRPKDAAEVKRFVHLAGYYRRFVQGFGSIMAPLTKMLRKDADWEWASTQEAAFEHIKLVLTSKPLLIYPNFHLPFRVVTDASKIGLGACLMQDNGQGWQPVAYASKVTSKTEENYGITELECLAVVWAIKLFRPYLYGRRFTIVTDHAALKWLMTSPNLTGKLHRWALTLQEFDFDVEYRPGSTNVVADALSRAPVKILAAIGRRRRMRRRENVAGVPSGTTATTISGGGKLHAVDTPSNDLLHVVASPAMPDASQTVPTGCETSAVAETPAMAMGAQLMSGMEDVLQEEMTDEDVVRTGWEESGRPAPQAQTTKKRSRSKWVAAEQSRPVTRAAKRRADEAQLRGDAVIETRERVAGERETPPDGSLGMTAGDVTLTMVNSTSRSALAGTRAGSPMGKRAVTWSPSVEQQQVHRAARLEDQQRRRGNDAERSSSRWRGDTSAPVQPTSQNTLSDNNLKTKMTAGNQNKRRRLSDATHPLGETSEAAVSRSGQRGGKQQPMRDGRGQRTGDEQRAVMQTAQRVAVRSSGEPTLQLTDEAISTAQARSRLVQRLVTAGRYHGMDVATEYGLVLIKTPSGKRVVLPPELWSVAFKESHDSVWAGHLRAPHTYSRIAQVYWWPRLQREVKRWVLGCQECGSRKARPREVIPPLRSIRGGDVGDRWALDVAGPLPTTEGGKRYVIAAVEYVTRYAVAITVERHTAENVAKFLMKQIVLKFGPFRELLTDGAPELTGRAIEQLVIMLQAEQTTPVPYRPQMIGLVERFHRTWKDCVSVYMNMDEQRDWDAWIDFAVYAYNSGRHSTVLLSPNELMMGRKLRAPNELLRQTSVAEAGEMTAYHRRLLRAMKAAHACAEQARVREQKRQAKYYDRKVRMQRSFNAGDRVWMFRPPKGPKASKFVHSWIGPMKIVEPAGYDNFLIEREDQDGGNEQLIAHVSFLVSYHYPHTLLGTIAADIKLQLENEGALEREAHVTTARETTRTTSAPVQAATAARIRRQHNQTVGSEAAKFGSNEILVELRRRRRRNKAGHYVLEYLLRPIGSKQRGDAAAVGSAAAGSGAAAEDEQWVSVAEYDELFQAARVVEDSGCEEGV